MGDGLGRNLYFYYNSGCQAFFYVFVVVKVNLAVAASIARILRTCMKSLDEYSAAKSRSLASLGKTIHIKCCISATLRLLPRAARGLYKYRKARGW
jgi:hypothetical protein